MPLIIGVDSYISVEEADELLQKYFFENDPPIILWSNLTVSNKEIYLRKACLQLESLPFRGAKEHRTQILSFPRRDGNMATIKLAQALQAIMLTDTIAQDEQAIRNNIRQSGVKSYKIGNLSETFSSTLGRNFGNVSIQVLEILKRYLSGGYYICT